MTTNQKKIKNILTYLDAIEKIDWTKDNRIRAIVESIRRELKQ